MNDSSSRARYALHWYGYVDICSRSRQHATKLIQRELMTISILFTFGSTTTA